MEQKNRKIGICIVTSYPPRKCGIATFSVALKNNISLIDKNIIVKIAAINAPEKLCRYSERVIAEIEQDKKETYIRAADIINRDKDIDIVSLQHVFSLFGGKNGEFIIDFLKHLKKPIIVTMHMIYSAAEQPHYLEVVDKSYKSITEKIVSLTNKIIVIIQPMADVLEKQYNVPPEKIAVIPHGIPEVEPEDPEKYKKIIGFENKKIISTFGLIRPKKGLEYLIRAMPEIAKKYPEVVALILGEHHPNRPIEYYNFLKEEAGKIGLLNKKIFFIERYLKLREIITYLLATDVFITPYLVPEQTSSGVIAYALGCGKAIISTPFLYAKEVLKDGRGMFIDYKDSRSIFNAVDFLLSHNSEKRGMEKKAYKFAQNFLWKEVTREYLKIFNEVLNLK
ncbi:MAG: glycosyltransferase [Patescibacteria group bacterium]